MGWILQQKTCTCKKVSPTCCPDGWNHVLTGGAFCKPEERNYSEIEGAATAILKGLQDGMGCKKLHMATDHQPLVTTLGKQSAMTSNKLMETCATEIALWSWRHCRPRYPRHSPRGPGHCWEDSFLAWDQPGHHQDKRWMHDLTCV